MIYHTPDYYIIPVDFGILTNLVFLNSFLSDYPTFTLVGESRGGPPTFSYWTRNGIRITPNDSFLISLSFQSIGTRSIHSVYLSTLVVNGTFPGVYQFSATNRIMSNWSSNSIAIQGEYYSRVLCK